MTSKDGTLLPCAFVPKAGFEPAKSVGFNGRPSDDPRKRSALASPVGASSVPQSAKCSSVAVGLGGDLASDLLAGRLARALRGGGA